MKTTVLCAGETQLTITEYEATDRIELRTRRMELMTETLSLMHDPAAADELARKDAEIESITTTLKYLEQEANALEAAAAMPQ